MVSPPPAVAPCTPDTAASSVPIPESRQPNPPASSPSGDGDVTTQSTCALFSTRHPNPVVSTGAFHPTGCGPAPVAVSGWGGPEKYDHNSRSPPGGQVTPPP